MAIQVRRGQKAKFDPQKMLPGEWAVSIDQETENQIIWMCFSAGVVKRMGTYEDFKAQISEATDDIREQYIETFNEIKAYMEELVDEAEGYKNTASAKATAASNSATAAAGSASTASTKATAASNSAAAATASADDAEDYSLLSESYAHGNTGARENEDVDNAKYYYEQAVRISQGLEGSLLPMGTITFAQLATSPKQAGYMYNISDAFTTDSTFKEGAEHDYPAGTNVYYTADGYWDCLAGIIVTGVKGNAESSYRTGNVNITPANIGAAPTSHASSATTYGAASASYYGHAKASATTPKAPGTAATGSETATFARGDHVHPLPEKLATTRYIDGVGFDGSANIVHYNTCSTAAATAAKVISITGISLVKGTRVAVCFSNGNTAANPTLNVSSTGAKPIYYHGVTIPEDYIKQYTTLELVYTGNNWSVVGDLTQYQVDLLKTDLDLIKSPTALYSSTTGIYASALQTWAYTTVSGLSAWKEVRMWVEVGDAACGYQTFTRDKNTVIVNGYYSVGYNSTMRVLCDFTNNRVGIYVTGLTGWGYANLRVLRVEGLIKNS